MSTISIQDIQRDLPGFIQRIEACESFVVLRDDQPLAEVKAIIQGNHKPRPFGLCAGEFTVPDDFDDPLSDEILKEFEGK